MNWKTSDITQARVLAAYACTERPVDEVLMRETGAPLKVVWAAMEREYRHGLVTFGTSLRGGWLTDKGREALNSTEGQS